MAGGEGDPLPESTEQQLFRLYQFRDGLFREVSTGTILNATSLTGLVAALSGILPPAPHRHTLPDLPAGILGVAVGTATARPNFPVVFWIAPAEPTNAAVGDVWLNDPDS